MRWGCGRPTIEDEEEIFSLSFLGGRRSARRNPDACLTAVRKRMTRRGARGKGAREEKKSH